MKVNVSKKLFTSSNLSSQIPPSIPSVPSLRTPATLQTSCQLVQIITQATLNVHLPLIRIINQFMLLQTWHKAMLWWLVVNARFKIKQEIRYKRISGLILNKMNKKNSLYYKFEKLLKQKRNQIITISKRIKILK